MTPLRKTSLLANSAVLLLTLAVVLSGVPVRGDEPAKWLQGELESLMALYGHLHANPELSLHEEQTAKRVAGELRALGIEVTTGVGGHGVVGVLHNGDGKTLLIRTDMDALPVVEQTGLPFASKVRVPHPDGEGQVGVMHACGHDLHMTNFIGVARYLATHKNLWKGTILFVAQPAEEKGLGARAMLEHGLYRRFGHPDCVIALHVASNLPAGLIGYRKGYALANVDSCDITLFGRGGHGAFPHTTIDPIVQAAQLVLALQTIVAREVDPVESAVISVGSIQAGTKHNIIPDRCHLQATIRSYSPKVREQLKQAIKRKAKGIAASMGAAEPQVQFSEGLPAVYNDPALVDRVVPAMQKVLGKERVVEVPPVMGAEDFALYRSPKTPIFMFWLGSVDRERLAKMNSPVSLHSPFYYPDARPALQTGVPAMIAAALELLK